MKKIMKSALISVLIVVVAVGVWLIGYNTQKSQDNLPSLESITKMDEADVSELLVGYRNYQLDDVWGKPAIETENTWIWKIDKYTQLQVNFKNKNKIVACRVGSVLQAKILEIVDKTYLVEPVEGSPELNSADKITVPITHLDSSLEPEVGDLIEIYYSGEMLETYPAKLQEVSAIRIVAEMREGQWDLPLMLTINGENYIAEGMPISELPDDFEFMGEITAEEANYSGLDGCNYYANKYISSFDEFYVYQECGTPIDENTIDSTQRQWAYVKWVREGFERD